MSALFLLFIAYTVAYGALWHFESNRPNHDPSAIQQDHASNAPAAEGSYDDESVSR